MSNDTTAKANSSSATDKSTDKAEDTVQQSLVPLNSPEGQACLKEFFSAQFELNHDLNNPLAGVVGYLELALTDSETIPARPLELLKNVQKCADRMDELIQEYVKSKRRLQTTVDLSDVVDEG
jgi:signal transduction histidine kinase